jgi:predicted transposase YdaD
MAKRVWEYNVLATCKYKLPVLSFVIHLKKDRSVAKSPLVVVLPDGGEVHRFKFSLVELYKVPTEQLKQTGLVGLLPLLPLTERGANQEVVEEMITDVQSLAVEESQANLLSMGLAFASLAFGKQQANQDWLIRRFQMLDDILQETELYKYIMREGQEKGLQQGLQRGLQQGRKEAKEALQQAQQEKLQELRQAVLDIVQVRFPKIVRIAKGQTAIIEDPKALRYLIVKMSTAQNAEEAKLYLLGEDDEDE